MRRTYLLGILFFAVLALYAFRLNEPAKIYYDETYHVNTAREFITLSGNTEYTHPPLGKELIAAAIIVFGDHPWVWRIFPLFFGMGTIAVFFLLAEKIFKDTKAALFATLLFVMDGMTITQARIAMLNTQMLFFMMMTVYFWVKALERKKEAWPFILTGVFLGLTFATRWVGLGVTLVMGLLFVPHLSNLKKPEFYKKAVLYVLLPMILVYFATHLILPFIKGYEWSDIFKIQKRMFEYHHKLKATHNYGSTWWGWTIMKRPIWYFFETKGDLVYGVLCIGNPVIFWPALLAMVYLISRIVQYRCQISALIFLGYLSQLMPWALISRVKFFHYYYTATPFLALALSVLFRDVWNMGKAGKAVTILYFLCVVVSFIYWFPLYTAYPIPHYYFEQHLWFKSWI